LGTLVLALQTLAAPAGAHDESADRLEYPLGRGKLAVRTSGRLTLTGGWSGPHGTLSDPTAVISAIAVDMGDGSADTMRLDPRKWTVLPKGRGYRYRDPEAPDIRAVVVRLRKNGGSLTIKGNGSWTVGPDATVTVNLTVGTARWCAEFTGPFKRTRAATIARSETAPAHCECAEVFASTWAAIQGAVFERHACTQAVCHGRSPGQGNLDLSPAVAYQSLFNVPSLYEPELLRVKPGDRTHSVLFRRLAKGTFPEEYAEVPGSPMPSGLPPLAAEELEAVRLWIMSGAPETGIVAGTDTLLATCLPPPDPIKITPPAPPAPEAGVQFYAPPWVIEPRNAAGENGEDEVCHATFYDLSAQIPPGHPARLPASDPYCAFWNENSAEPRDCFYYNHTELTQDPNSHHSIIHLYRGAHDFDRPDYTDGFGPFTCRDGANAGAPCDPRDGSEECPGSTCAGRVQSGVACIGYGPPDFAATVSGSGSSSAPSIGGSQQAVSDQAYAAGVFATLPIKGTIVWNSHAFNVASEPTTNEQYLNVFFATTPAERQWIVRGIFDARYIFTQQVPPFTEREYCATTTLPQGARLFELSSHTHQRGVRFRIWEPPNAPCPRGPFGPDRQPGTADDCDPPDGSRRPTVTTVSYNDPVQYRYETPLALDGADEASRTIRWCALYDNGAADRSTVKRQSTSPVPPIVFAPGGPCPNDERPTYGVRCLNESAPQDPDGVPVLCGGDDRRCDGSPGAGDGVCDACPLLGGVTTEDEMFILLGLYYCPGCS
jgi:hypothetical protein